MNEQIGPSSNTEPTEPTEPHPSAVPTSPVEPMRVEWREKVLGFPYLRLAWIAVLAACPAVALLPTILPAAEKLPLSNDIATHSRHLGALAVVVTSMVGGLVLVVPRYRRARSGGADLASVLGEVGTTYAWLLLLPLVTMLGSRGVEAQAPIFALAMLTVLTGSLSWMAYVHAATLTRIASKIPAFFAPITVVGAGIAYAIYLGTLSQNRLRIFSARIHDLGIYDSLFWHAAHGKGLASDLIKGGTHMGAHYDPILLALGPMYLLAPRAHTILLLQTIWLATGVIPAFLVGSRLAKSRAVGVVLALVWCLQPAIHGAHLYDFHSLTLAAPTLLWLLLFLELEKHVLYAITLAVLLVTREDLSLVGLCVGVYAALSGRRRTVWVGTIAASVGYLLYVKRYVMTDASLLMQDSATTYAYGYYFRDVLPTDQEGALGILVSLVTNPVFALKHMFSEPKVILLVELLLPLAFLPLASGRALVMLAYGTAFMLLASKLPVYMISFHYTVFVFPLAMVCAALVLARLDTQPWVQRLDLPVDRLRVALLVWMVVGAALLGLKFGGLAPNDSFKPGGHPMATYTLTDSQITRYRWVRENLSQIGSDARVSATEHLGPHVSNREFAFHFPVCGRDCDFLFLDTSELDPNQKKELENVEKSGKYQKVSELDTLVLWKKR